MLGIQHPGTEGSELERFLDDNSDMILACIVKDVSWTTFCDSASVTLKGFAASEEWKHQLSSASFGGSQLLIPPHPDVHP